MSKPTTIKNILSDRKFLSAADASPLFTKHDGMCEPNCPECGGSGWLRLDVPVGDPRFGKTVHCSRRNLDAEGYGQKCGLLKAERALTWGSLLDIEGGNVMEAARVVRSTLQRGYGWVYLWGSWGLGKSLILQIATAVSLQSGYDASYIRMSEVLDYLRGGFGSGDYEARLERMKSLPVLCIDEFEKVNDKDDKGMSWGSDKKFLLMDNRYVSATRGESVTVMAGNLNPASFGGELWDRIQDGRFTVVKLHGESVRPGMGWEDGLPVERGSVFDRGELASVFDRGESHG